MKDPACTITHILVILPKIIKIFREVTEKFIKCQMFPEYQVTCNIKGTMDCRATPFVDISSIDFTKTPGSGRGIFCPLGQNLFMSSFSCVVFVPTVVGLRLSR